MYAAYKKDFQNGIISVGDVCNANCFFCSQKWNPPGVIKRLGRFLTMDEIKHFTTYLYKVKWINSGIHTNTGEFFLHPNAIEILNYLAANDKLSEHNYSPVYSNGMGLTLEHILLLKK